MIEKIQDAGVSRYIQKDELIHGEPIGYYFRRVARQRLGSNILAAHFGQLFETFDRFLGLDTTIYRSPASQTGFPLTVEEIMHILRTNDYVVKLTPVSAFYDIPQIYQYEARTALRGKTDGHLITTSGYGVDRSGPKAMLKALMEGVERRVLATYRKNWLTWSRWQDLRGEKLHPYEIQYFSKKQTRTGLLASRRLRKNSRLNWAKSLELQSKRTVWIPAQLVYWNYKHVSGEPVLYYGTTSGQAAGFSLEEALVNALLELIERDSFMINWLRQIPPDVVELHEIASLNPPLNELVEKFDRYRLDLHILSLHSDFEVPIYVSVIHDMTSVGPAIAIGAGSDFDHSVAIEKSVLEALSVHNLVRFWLRNKPVLPSHNTTAYTSSMGRKDRLLLWSQQKMVPKIRWFLESGQRVNVPRQAHVVPPDVGEKLAILRRKLHALGMRCYYVDATPQDLASNGISVVRVIVPELVPLYLQERYPTLGIPRLYTQEQKGLPPGVFNSVPHPFP